SRFNVYESRVVMVIVHKTIAFNKLKDRIPRLQFTEITGIADRHLDRTINSLLKKGVIFKKDSVYGIQRDFEKWETPPLQVYKVKTPPLEVKNPPLEVKNPPLEVDSRDLSKRAYQEKGLSTSEREEKKKEYKTGLAMLKEAIKRSPDRKRKDH
ncbi:unnamed protein product, partial [marine sediment metagenome]